MEKCYLDENNFLKIDNNISNEGTTNMITCVSKLLTFAFLNHYLNY